MKKQWKRVAVLAVMAAIVLVLMPNRALAEEIDDSDDDLKEGTIVEILDEPVPITSEPETGSASGNAQENWNAGTPAPETGDPVIFFISLAGTAALGLGACVLKSHIRVRNASGKSNKRIFTK